MLNHVIAIFRPSNTKSAVISSCISLAASNLGAKSVATATILLTGLMSLPHNQAANVVTQALMSFMLPETVIQAPMSVARKIPLPKHTPHLAAKNANRLNLRSLEKDYTCVFSGKVTCGGGPCNSADLKVHVASKENSDAVKIVNVQPDGTYTASFFLRATLNDHVDYWIVADSPDSASKQVQGRQILLEETTVSIDEPIRLL